MTDLPTLKDLEINICKDTDLESFFMAKSTDLRKAGKEWLEKRKKDNYVMIGTEKIYKWDELRLLEKFIRHFFNLGDEE